MKYFDEIKRRLNGEMSADEAKAFDEQLQKNEDLAREYELQKMEEDILDLAVEEKLLAEIKAIAQEQDSNDTEDQEAKVIRQPNWRRILSIAAGVAVLIAAYFVIQYINEPPSPLAVARDAYNDNPPNLSGTKAIGDNAQATVRHKLLLLSDNQEDINTAIGFFEAQKANAPEAAFYLGHGYWKTEDYQKALLNFEYFLENAEADNRLIPQAEFYKSLTLLATGRTGQAILFIKENKVNHYFEEPWNDTLKKLATE